MYYCYSPTVRYGNNGQVSVETEGLTARDSMNHTPPPEDPETAKVTTVIIIRPTHHFYSETANPTVKQLAASLLDFKTSSHFFLDICYDRFL